MKLSIIAAAALAVPASAFTVGNTAGVRQSSALFAEDEGVKINTKIDLDSDKVVNMETLEKGKKVYCRCWLSDTFPLCNGSHAKHNEATGDNVGPLIVTVKKGD
uniref:Iron-binding zinc finger CDGSH type domain-containing protein n=1 Tax=Craspedostauros australis TaxID=1486917 RepID=A0A7R9ZSX6_9STRA|mmetsp:Transcript_9199/g.24834  ORF Transcript_9199/g.24834 Transcript_9199/m.24834 type:complete len:104 (+) Transcript_9199:188-499(+)